jgi:hypothetical protein
MKNDSSSSEETGLLDALYYSSCIEVSEARILLELCEEVDKLIREPISSKKCYAIELSWMIKFQKFSKDL